MVRSHVGALLRRMPDPQYAVLGCTHYPILEHIFQAALGTNVKVFSQANLVAASLEDYLRRHSHMVGESRSGCLLTTGDPQAVSDAATRFLSKPLHFEAA